MKANWKSGLTVALVSIPMSVSLAVASGSTPTVGIITAVWAGLIAAILGGSDFNIVGPAGALSGILATFAFTHGAGMLPMLAIVSGVFILVSYALKLEKYLMFIPASTVHGFTLGVGLMLAFGQLNSAFGLTGLPAHSDPFANVMESFKHLPALDPATTTIFIVFLIGLFVLLRYTPKIPAVIALTPVGILLGWLADSKMIPFTIQTLGSKFPNIQAAFFKLPQFGMSKELLVASITVAAVAIIETMLCAKIADGITGTKHDRRKEMLALSLANIGSGLAGGLPATAVLARTSLNAKSGATHRTSEGLNAIFVLIISSIFLGLFKYIPLSVVAAILVFTSYRMIEQHHFIRMYRHDKKSFVISIIVGFVTIYWDPMVGILLGTAVALLLFIHKLSKGQFELVANDIEEKKITDHIHGEHLHELPANCDTLVYSIKGHLAYFNSLAHISRFEEKDAAHKNVILRMRELFFIDLDGVDAFDDIVETIERNGLRVLVTGVNPLIETSLHESKAFLRLKASGAVYDSTSSALKALGY